MRGPSGARAGARRDAAASAAEAAEEEEEEALDRAAADAGLSSFALPCDADSECLTHRCDARVGHCRFPCQSDDDCDPKAYCDVEGGALAACFRR